MSSKGNLKLNEKSEATLRQVMQSSWRDFRENKIALSSFMLCYIFPFLCSIKHSIENEMEL